MVIAAGTTGALPAEVIASTGVSSIKTLMQIVCRANKLHGTRIYSRRIKRGESRLFHFDSLPAKVAPEFVTGRKTSAVTMLDVIAYRTSLIGPEGMASAEMYAGMNQAQFGRAAGPLRKAGKLFSYGYGPSLRYFASEADMAAYRAIRRAASAKVRDTRVKRVRAKQAQKTRQAKARPAAIVQMPSKPWTPPPKPEPRPVVIPAGLEVQRLAGFTGDRWGITKAPKIITGEDCREWAKAVA
jgi:hypothetical protein